MPAHTNSIKEISYCRATADFFYFLLLQLNYLIMCHYVTLGTKDQLRSEA